MTTLEDLLVERIESSGPMGFDDYVAQALYAPGLGFYARGGGAGRRRDFLTSPEVGPLFGTIVGRALDAWWDELGRPDPYVVVEAGAGPGTLARTVLAARPRCRPALRMVLVEPAVTQWTTHPVDVTTRADLPEPGEYGRGPVVVLANELLDNLPFGMVELLPAGSAGDAGDRDGVWCEVVVDVDHSGGSARLVERHVALDPARQGWCWGRAGRDVPVGTRLPIEADAVAWLAGALDLAARGRVVVVDYASTTTELARRPWSEWVRTYAAHGHAGGPLDDPGHADITVEVAVDQLATVRAPDLDRSQADFLGAHGLDDLVAQGRESWREHQEGGATLDLASLAGRSLVHEAEALTDRAGLGGFRVLEWVGGLADT